MQFQDKKLGEGGVTEVDTLKQKSRAHKIHTYNRHANVQAKITRGKNRKKKRKEFQPSPEE